MTDRSSQEGATELAYAAAGEAERLMYHWGDAIDTKAIGIFGVASIIVTVVPTMETFHAGPPLVAWVIAICFWVLAARSCYAAFSPREFRVGPNPRTLADPAWLELTPTEYKGHMLTFMGRAYDHNKQELDRKAEALGSAIWYTAGEVMALSAGLVVAVL
jgi:hypothetical protein